MNGATGTAGDEEIEFEFGYSPAVLLERDDDATPEQKAARAKAAAWAAPIKQKFAAQRKKRADELISRQAAITESVAALMSRVPVRFDSDVVLIRNEFVRLRPGPEIEKREKTAARLAEIKGECGCSKGLPACSDHKSLRDSRPPATKLAMTPRGVHLPLLLMSIYMAQQEPDRRWTNQFDVDTKRTSSWAQFIGYELIDPTKPGNAKLKEVGRQVRRALHLLARNELVRRSRRTGTPWQGWSLLEESGEGRVYRAPGERYAFPIPVEFWTQGWHLVLTSSEITCYMAMRAHHHALATPAEEGGWKASPDGDDNGFYMPQSLRTNWYGLTDEMYAAHNTLADFGLIRRMDSRLQWDKRKRQKDAATDQGQPDKPHNNDTTPSTAEDPADKPYKFALMDSGLRRPALETVVQSLRTFPYPAWLEGPGESFVREIMNAAPAS